MKMMMRRELLGKRKALSPDWIAEKSGAACARVLDLPEWKRAKTVMLYAATRSEVQTKELIARALAEGKRVCLPVRSEEQSEMMAFFIGSPEELVLGDLGYLEPSKMSLKAEPHEIELAIVPGIAFDEKGNRLGRGMHYYDGFLRRLRARKVALAFEMQIVPEVPTEDHDVPVDKIVTEKRVINCGK